MQALKAGTFYLALVFGAGFVLGIVRVLWIVPRVGTRTAELLEVPFMLLVIIAAAWWVVRYLSLPATPMARLSAGFIALSFLLLAEFTVVLAVRRLAVAKYLAGRDEALTRYMYAAFARRPASQCRLNQLPLAARSARLSQLSG